MKKNTSKPNKSDSMRNVQILKTCKIQLKLVGKNDNDITGQKKNYSVGCIKSKMASKDWMSKSEN